MTLLPADEARSERVDRSFRQLERWLGLSAEEATDAHPMRLMLGGAVVALRPRAARHR